MSAEQQPNFIFRGIRRFAEVSLPWAIGITALGLLVTRFGVLAAPGFGLTLADGVALGLIKKSRGI